MPPKLRYTNLLKKSLPKVKPKDLIKEWKIFVGDTVQVVSGRKDVGKQGKVLEVLKNENRLIVEGVMLAKKNMKPNPEAPKGSQFLTEMAISYESVRLVDPVLNQPTLVKLLKMPNPITGRSQTTRLSALSGQLIPIPEKKDPFKDKKEGPLDTKANEVNQTTWTPSLFDSPFPTPFLNQLERFRRINKEGSGL